MVYFGDDLSRDALWTSSQVKAEDAVAVWTSLVSTEIVEMMVEAGEDGSFGASWRRYGLGPVDLNFLTCVRQRVLRSKEMIAKSCSANFEMLFARRGRIVVTHANRQSIVPEGGVVLLADQSSYTLDFPDGCETLTARIPQTWLRNWAPEVDQMVGIALGGGQLWARPLEGLLTAIADAGLEEAALPRAVIADQLGAMCAMLVHQPTRSDRFRSELVSRIYENIHRKFADPGISPKHIAADLGISRRHLHRLLAEQRTTFGAILNSARLQEAERLFLRPQQGQKQIGDIAWQVGFADQSHFARLFRIRNGVSPTTYRRAALSRKPLQ